MPDLDELAKVKVEKWMTLIQASLAHANHLGGLVMTKSREEVERDLDRAAVEYAAAKEALIEGMRPAPVRRRRGRA